MAMDKFITTTGFKGYRNKEDVTNMEPGWLVVGSQNVLINYGKRISTRGGTILDCATDDGSNGGIKSSYDWKRYLGDYRHMRSSGDVNGKLQFRYVDETGNVLWKDVITGLGKSFFRYAEFWRQEELMDIILLANGTSSLYEWTGATTTFASATSNTLTKQGTKTWAEEGFYFGGNITASTIAFVAPNKITDSANGFVGAGFYAGQKITVSGSGSNNGNYSIVAVTDGQITVSEQTITSVVAGPSKTIISERQIVIDGTTYSYTGGESTTTLTGVTPDPTIAVHTVGSLIIQKPRSAPISVFMSGIPNAYTIDLVATMGNQLFIGDQKSRNVYMSYVNNPYDFTYSLPRLPGEGALFTLDSCPVGFVVQEQDVYLSCGNDDWYKTEFILSADLSEENVKFKRLKTSQGQAAWSQELITKVKNNVMFVTREPSVDNLGRIENYFGTPQAEYISNDIKNEFDYLNFTDGVGVWWKGYYIFSVPSVGKVYMRNFIERYWEAPQVMDVVCFSIIDGDLYGHSYTRAETYKLFSGHSDRIINDNDPGLPIEAIALLSFNNYGDRVNDKNFDSYFVEGYIPENTTLQCGVQYDYDGCSTNVEFPVNGAEESIVCIGGVDASHGRRNIGQYTFTRIGENNEMLPPKFWLVKTLTRIDFREVQFYFYSNDVDQWWEILSCGPEVTYAQHKPRHRK